MTTEIAPLRKAKQTAAVLLVAGVAFLTFTNPVMGLLSALGIALSSFAVWTTNPDRVTKRRALQRVWGTLGVYAVAMAVLSAVTVGLGILLLHRIELGPIAWFVMIACWLPFVAFLFGRKDR
jgi:hypothetical protein